MIFLKKISDKLKDDKSQRIIYLIGFVLWIIYWIDKFKYYDLEYIPGIRYLWIFLIPILLFGIQFFMNNRAIWLLIIILSSFITFYIVSITIFMDVLVNLDRDYVPETFWSVKLIFKPILILLFLFMINWILWKMKPEKR